MSKNYELWLHYKQGSDFHNCLEKTQENVPEALRLWASHFKEIHDHCLRLAKAFDGKKITAYADTHHIGFEAEDNAAQRCLEVMASEELLQVFDNEDDEDDEDGTDEEAVLDDDVPDDDLRK